MNKYLRTLNNKLEEWFEIRFIRSPRKLEFKKGQGKNNIIVEFFGATGIGKTTTRKHYFKTNDLQLVDHELMQAEDIERLVQGISDNETKFIGQNKFYKNIYIDKINSFIHEKSLTGKECAYLYNYYKIIKKDYFISNHIDNKIVLLDEHLLRRFPKLPDSILKLDNKNNFLQNRLFIHCTTSPNVHLQYIQKRISDKDRGLEAYKKRTGNEFQQQLNLKIEENIQRANKIKRIGGKIIEIDTSEPLSVNRKLIDEFISQNL